jgi:cytochrome c
MMGNDPLFVNKVAAAVIGALLIAMTAGFIVHFVYHPKMLDKHVYAIDGGKVAASATTAAPEKAGPDPIAPLLAAANVDAGKKVAGKCAACHTFDKGGKRRIGPNLWNIVGAKQRHDEGFKYSNAFGKLTGQWTYEDLNKFLYKPRDYANGTKMSFPGLKKAEDRANLIAYLRGQADTPQPLP